MNPMMVKVVQSLLRTLLAAYGADLVAPEEYDTLIQALTTAAVGVWSLYNAWKSQQKVVTALSAARPMSEAQLNQKIASGGAASVMTPASEIPHPPTP